MADPSRRVVYKKGDRQPALQVQITNPDGTPRDITADIITFNMGKPGAAKKVNAGATTTVAATNGIVEYRWGVNDLDTVDEYRAEFVLNGNDHRPKDGYIIVAVEDVV